MEGVYTQEEPCLPKGGGSGGCSVHTYNVSMWNHTFGAILGYTASPGQPRLHNEMPSQTINKTKWMSTSNTRVLRKQDR